ncbi:DUF5696 domain-containing protein [Bacillus sp. FJAT-26390]|uniref:DUF5696 domain-containing protein n=1 Tax=Bacillus sp. FJAT-26390 TaxID=1743142 RepID=UPI000807E29C|nr:DUF5696 domain-containing protein [Bacillus sp. FJAT-26390]OBZ17664.1 hypothetical protein A7975_07385 [Bacillus sp. FJAT-26390]
MKSNWRMTIAAIVFSMLAWASSMYISSAEPSDEAGSAKAEPAAEQPTNSATESPAQFANESQAAETLAMEMVAENESLALYFDAKTTEIAVKNKRDGSFWHSNPQGREQDSKASGINKSMLSSQLLLHFSDASGKPQQYNSFSQSVQYNQFEYKKLNDGIQITYTIGEKLRGLEQIPPVIGEKRFQTLILDKIKDDEGKKELLNRFKHNPEKQVYERWDAALNGMALKRTLAVFAEVGYNEEEMNVDREANSGGNAANQALFVLPVTYRLAGDQFVVHVSTESLDSKGYYLQTLAVLPYFGAAGTGQEGYMFVPDGSGSLIYLNNGKLDAAPYKDALYGIDATRFSRLKPLGGSPARLPVFGMKKDDTAFVAIIEDGDGIARVEADISGRTNSYNYVHSSYEINAFEPLTLSGAWTTQTVPKFQAKPYQGDITIRYGFLQGEAASYSGMASYYRTYLTEKHGLERVKGQGQTPFFVEIIGGVPKKKFFLGVPYNSYQPLTTFDQAQEILEDLQGDGIENIKLRYTGWFNGGIAHSSPSSISVDKKLGGKKGFAKLLNYTNRNGIEVYPDAAFMSVQDSWTFSPKKEASRTITGALANIYPYNPAGYFKETEGRTAYALSPKKLPDLINSFARSYGNLDASGLSLRDMGGELNSDFNAGHMITREETKRVVLEQLAKLAGSSKLMMSGGNAWALPYADHIVNAPLYNSGYNITDRGVPFYEIALHGYIDYAGEALNIADEQTMRHHVLKALETGANLNFTWFYAESSSVKGSEFDYLFSANYRNWIGEAKSAYDEVNAVLSGVQTQPIINHRMLEKGLYQTTYEDGTTVIVNYNDYAINVNGDAVESMGYLIGGERN